MPFAIVRNDITRMHTDAIVNAANSRLQRGGGVDGAVHAAAGPKLQKELDGIGFCAPGDAVVTGGYGLNCKYIFHTVGPIWQDGTQGEAGTLYSCYKTCLTLARKLDCQSISFPLISSGIYGYPKREAIDVATRAIKEFLLDGALDDVQVYLVLFSKTDMELGGECFRGIREYIDDAYAEEYMSRPTEKLRKLRHKNLMPETHACEEAEEAHAAPEEHPDKQESADTLLEDLTTSMPVGKAYEAAEAEAEKLMPERGEAAPKRLVSRPKPAFERSAQSAGQFAPVTGASDANKTLRDMLRNIDEGFSQMLLRKIDERGMKDSECYRRANVDRRVFNIIKNQSDYHAGKPTVLAFAIALRLDLEETREMLAKAGYSFTRSNKTDIVIEYYINHNNYDIFEINEVLFEYDQQLLGSI
ncbi:MAG: macro domain-containing protein [Clostridia bacterium]|nr:macro domain-containing protein [Clostridia bacterium]